MQPDDKILVAGESLVPGESYPRPTIARYNVNGSLDIRFDGNGIAQLGLNGNFTSINFDTITDRPDRNRMEVFMASVGTPRS